MAKNYILFMLDPPTLNHPHKYMISPGYGQLNQALDHTHHELLT